MSIGAEAGGLAPPAAGRRFAGDFAAFGRARPARAAGVGPPPPTAAGRRRPADPPESGS